VEGAVMANTFPKGVVNELSWIEEIVSFSETEDPVVQDPSKNKYTRPSRVLMRKRMDWMIGMKFISRTIPQLLFLLLSY
jgi:hypothetical protein